MGKVTIRIPHVAWRDGRPRFVPGPSLRALGYRGEDLKRPLGVEGGGAWLTLEETIAWAEARLEDISKARVTGKPAGKPAARAAARVGRGIATRGLLTLADLVAAVLALPALRGQDQVEGRKRRKALAPKTVRYYRDGAKVLETLDPDIWAAPAAAISPKVVEGYLDRVEVARGLAMARCVRATLSMAYGRLGGRHGLVNPCESVRLPVLSPRLRVGEPAEMAALVAAADAIGRPEIGDSVMLGLFTGQRQGDRLTLVGGQTVEGRLVFRQAKTGAVVMIRPGPSLTARLAAAAERRARARVAWPQVVVDEVAGRPWAPAADHYRHVYAEARAAAVAGVKGEDGEWLVAPTPSLADFRDQDLRDTAVTWLALGGASVPEICSVTGHALDTATGILKHYLGQHPELSDHGLAKMIAWLDTKGTAL